MAGEDVSSFTRPNVDRSWAMLPIATRYGACPVPVLGYGDSGVLGHAFALAAFTGAARRA
ncbi:hypothetical protein M9979_07950 [Sphingomonas sp. RP10(2022)]|uniref:Uncharacterized protein n=1 Tax=Sphingomonas liriopis TaxID=2949094 RepID=A0A9X2KQQ4_9SPHN|nr:hypothetical protein [Sphingomonas liriopis]MCP3734801.1 hypothetical protein [Sphingomonas liriopis]